MLHTPKDTESQYWNDSKSFGDLDLKFIGESYPPDHQILDTKVHFYDRTLCWITWGDKEAFAAELNAVIEKYRI